MRTGPRRHWSARLATGSHSTHDHQHRRIWSGRAAVAPPGLGTRQVPRRRRPSCRGQPLLSRQRPGAPRGLPVRATGGDTARQRGVPGPHGEHRRRPADGLVARAPSQWLRALGRPERGGGLSGRRGGGRPLLPGGGRAGPGGHRRHGGPRLRPSGAAAGGRSPGDDPRGTPRGTARGACWTGAQRLQRGVRREALRSGTPRSGAIGALLHRQRVALHRRGTGARHAACAV